MAKAYKDMNDEELAKARQELDKEIQKLRAEKKKIQDVVDGSIRPLEPRPGDHQIGSGG